MSTCRAAEASDVDVLVDFEPGRAPGFGFLRVAESLRPIFDRRRIDLHTVRGLQEPMRTRVLNAARTMYGDA